MNESEVLINTTVEEKDEQRRNESFTAEERETIISWSDEDDEIFIYSSQRKMVTKLLKNPLFKPILIEYNKNYQVYPKPLSVKGTIPIKALSLRKKITKRKLSAEQRKKLAEQMKKNIHQS